MFNIFKNIRGTIGTVLFHFGLLLLLYFFGFSTPLPLPAEEGILVNFGTELEGAGDIEPTFSNNQPVVNEIQDDIPPEQTTEEGYLTQDIEEAPEVRKAVNNNEDIEKKRIEEERKQKEELERKRQEEIARKKKEEEEKKQKQQEIDNMVSGAFSKGKNTDDNSSNSEGITKGKGNQGNEKGSVDSDNYSDFNLAGRSPLNLPKPEYNYQVEGKVVVEVTVDRSGKVTKAVPGVKGSTTLDENLLKAAEKAALEALFDVKSDAPAFQKGTITYYFRLQ